ncbi:hypothetical protein HX13_06380 [Chryseobacterium sp. P1-3]|nr:hypothetical protein HX13_06380 [Chryseobacterium sp. P1-3]
MARTINAIIASIVEGKPSRTIFEKKAKSDVKKHPCEDPFLYSIETMWNKENDTAYNFKYT